MIGALATRQTGAISHRQLVDAGLGEGAIRHRIAVGRLHPVHQGVYAVGHAALSARGWAWAALLATGPGAVLSHRSAAAVWGLRPAPDTFVEVTSVARSRRPRSGIRLHRPHVLLPQDVAERDGLPCTSVSRTIADVAAVIDPRGQARVLRRAERLEVLDVAGIEPHLRPGRRGSASLRRLLLEYREDLVVRSELEERFLELVCAARLPAPRVNVALTGLEVDFLWPEQRVVVETDGFAYHGGRQAFEADRVRDAALLTSGYRVLRLTWRQVTRERRATTATLRALLRPGCGPPPGTAGRRSG